MNEALVLQRTQMDEGKCKVCGTETVRKFLSLGKLPLGNAFLREDDVKDEKRFDLDLGFCSKCTLVQQMKPAPRGSLAKVYKNYRYVPIGGSLRSNLASLSQGIFDDFHLNADSFFVDIGSNDGALLSGIVKRCRTLGIEPATEISEMARKNGVETITGFFTEELVADILSKHGHADVATATQVLQHVMDLPQFMRDVCRLLQPDGILVVEGRYFADTVRKFSYDTVYHEMLSFFTLNSLIKLLETFGMEAFRAQHVDVYGGSLRVYAKNRENRKISIDRSVSVLLQDENALRLDSFETYVAFAKKVAELRDELHDLVVNLADRGKVAGYGAPSTGTTLLNFCDLGKDCIEYVVDDSPLKQGLLTPGTHIPIVDSTALTTNPPDYLLLIAWRLKAEILAKINHTGKGKMSVIVPLPEIEVMS
jgi:SAM-dependent methyltransferase